MVASISSLPTPAPSRATQSNAAFSAAFDALFAALPDFIDEANALGVDLELLVTQVLTTAYSGTSATSVTIGSGTKNFTTQAGRVYTTGQWLIAASAADPSNYMLGQISSYNASTGALALTVLSTGVGGSGTHSDWNIGLVPAPISRVRSNAATSFSSPLTFNSDNYDTYSASAQAGNLTIPVDAGTPVNGRKMTFELTCDATPRTITFTGGASKGFKPVGAGLIVAGSDYTLTLTASKTTIVACIYSSAKARWQVVGIAQES